MGERAHVHDQVAVAEGGAALGLPDLLRPALAQLAGDIGHLVRGEELALLDVDHAPAGGGGEEEVGLAAEEGGDLEHVAHRGDRRHLRALVDVGEHREAVVALHHREQLEPGLEAGAAGALHGGAVGLVEGALEHEVQLGEFPPDAAQRDGDGAADALVLQRAGPGDEEEFLGVKEHQRMATTKYTECTKGKAVIRAALRQTATGARGSTTSAFSRAPAAPAA